MLAPSRLVQRDVTANRHETWGGVAVDAKACERRSQATRTAKACGPDLPTLGSSSQDDCGRRWLSSPVHRLL